MDKLDAMDNRISGNAQDSDDAVMRVTYNYSDDYDYDYDYGYDYVVAYCDAGGAA